jgi:hypothetical protein
MASLAEKAGQSILTAEEQAELESYCDVGDLLALLQSKARIAIRQAKSER